MSNRKRAAAIVGVGTSHFQTRRSDVDLGELVAESVEEALDDARVTMSDIDAVILGQAPDPLHGIGHPEQSLASTLALNGKPLMRIHTGGATGTSAVQAGWWSVLSGRFDRVLVAGAERMGDNVHGAQRVLNEIWDPAYEALMPLNTIANCSLMAVRYMDRYGATEGDFAEIAVRMRANGALNERAHLRSHVSKEDVLASPLLTWPVRRSMSCPRSSGSAAVVLSAADTVDQSQTAAWIVGIAAATDTYFMGDRMRRTDGDDEYIAYKSLKVAVDKVYEMGRISDPFRELDVVEPYVPFSPYEPMMLEVMGIAPVGEAIQMSRDGAFDIDGYLPVSPSGGVMCTNPISVTAMVRVIEAAQQVRGRAGAHQIEGAGLALATGAGGDSQFYGACLVSSSADNSTTDKKR